MSEVTPEKAKEAKLNDVYGVIVTGVSENSPAAKAGLAGGDIITEFRGERVEGTLELARLVRETPPGRTVKLSVWRDGRSRQMTVEIGRASNLLSGNLLPPDLQDRLSQLQERLRRRFWGPDTRAQRQRGTPGAPVLGVTVQDVSGQFAQYLKAPNDGGVLIISVQAGSAAEQAGLQAGDVITAVDGERVHNVGELRAQIRPTAETRTVALRLVRDGAETTVNVEIRAATRRNARPTPHSSVPI